MRFHLVDRILEVEPGRRIRVQKNLTLGEEYLADHFPTFPVMPGVLMLQTVAEAAAWLMRVTDDFRYSMVVLREAKNVKYGQFMEPGRELLVSAELEKEDGPLVRFIGKGEAGGSQTVIARISLIRYNLKDLNPTLAETDARLLAYWRERYTLLRPVAQPAPAT
jgi:3-hydroxyacyl-[acyl-carrier-protein] dehydratase